ncbi:MBL fold metallo-hydrolase [Rhodobacterales bacterium]|nr:MBL fold metallo-hydrolase [Rhodobacterales bacterium]
MAKNANNSSAAPGENARFEELGRGCYAYSADGCSNSGVVIGERGVLVVDGQASPDLAEKVLEKIREKTDKPIKLLVFSHFHCENTLGADAFEAGEIIASDLTRRMMDTRGKEEIRVARNRFPQLFSGVKHDAAVAAPSMTIASSMTIDLGGVEVRLMHLGRGHTMGDLVVWVPSTGVIFAGDLVQTSAAPFCGDAHLTDWPRALDRILAFRPNALMPGQGRSALGAPAVAAAIETTRDFVTTLRDAAVACVDQHLGLKDTCDSVTDALAQQFGDKTDFEEHMPFNVARAYDEALGLDQPQVWTLERAADLQDAVRGVIAVSNEEEPASDDVNAQAQDARFQPDSGEADAFAQTDEATGDLVSDSAFAASLTGDEALDLTEQDIDREDQTAGEEAVSEDQQDDPESDEGSDERKVLEAARH